MSKHLTWDEIGDLYKERTNNSARLLPMDYVFDWAKEQPDIEEIDGGYLTMKGEKNEIYSNSSQRTNSYSINKRRYAR